jgi:hypothetical protein
MAPTLRELSSIKRQAMLKSLLSQPGLLRYSEHIRLRTVDFSHVICEPNWESSSRNYVPKGNKVKAPLLTGLSRRSLRADGCGGAALISRSASSLAYYRPKRDFSRLRVLARLGIALVRNTLRSHLLRTRGFTFHEATSPESLADIPENHDTFSIRQCSDTAVEGTRLYLTAPVKMAAH